jgi:hypothetical protein
VAISQASLLLLNSLSVAPLTEATTGRFRLHDNVQTIHTAVKVAGQLKADRQRQEVEKPILSPTPVTFDAKKRFVETILHVRNALDVFV